MTCKVIIEASAVFDLRGILSYISETLKEPVTAKRVYLSIKERLSTLGSLPSRQPLVDDKTFAARGLRKMPAENYTIFYVVDENANEVRVLRVLYNRREWRALL